VKHKQTALYMVGYARTVCNVGGRP